MENENLSLDEVDLEKELAIATEEKSISNPVLDAEPGAEQSATTESENDFVPESEIPIVEPQKVLYDSTKLAPAIVDVIDTLLSEGLPMLYEATLDKEDKVAMKILARKYRMKKDSGEIRFNDEDMRVMDVYLSYEEYCNELPLTESEKKSLLEPLIEVLKDVNYQTSPTNALIIAAVLIMIPRALPLGVNFMSKKNEAE